MYHFVILGAKSLIKFAEFSAHALYQLQQSVDTKFPVTNFCVIYYLYYGGTSNKKVCFMNTVVQVLNAHYLLYWVQNFATENV